LSLGPEGLLQLRNDAIASLALADLHIDREWGGAPLGVKQVAFDADFKRYARTEPPDSVLLYEVERNRELFRLSGVGDIRGLPHLHFSRDGRLLAIRHGRGRKTKIAIWDLEQRRKLFEVADAGGMAFTPDGHWAAVGHLDGWIRFYDSTTGRVGRQLQTNL